MPGGTRRAMSTGMSSNCVNHSAMCSSNFTSVNSISGTFDNYCKMIVL